MMNELYPPTYLQALEKLRALVQMRNRLLQNVAFLLPTERDVDPEAGYIVPCPTPGLRALLDQIDVVTSQVMTALEELNRQAEPIVVSPIVWAHNQEQATRKQYRGGAKG